MQKILIVSSSFYPEIENMLIEGAKQELVRQGFAFDIIKVPGALEIPSAIYLKKDKYLGFVALGCVIKGETFHFEVVANESARGLTNLATQYGTIIGNGILTVDNYKQGFKRADTKKLNKGAFAANAVISLIKIANS
jgi:6,7-dimethyl-8-ribityllumazine synthase